MANDIPWYVNDSRIGEALEEFKAAAYGKSVLDEKTKELLKFATASLLRCPHCTQSHLKRALAAGATKQEITEALLITAVQSAATQVSWDSEVFEKYLS
jgi:AhpD family alkylhydroperoxidase